MLVLTVSLLLLSAVPAQAEMLHETYRGPTVGGAEIAVGCRAVQVRTAHTSELSDGERRAVRALLEDEVFPGDFADEDWEHCLGGVHALAYDASGGLVGHAAVVMRRLLHGARALRCGYVEGVGVAPSARRGGVGAAVMAPLHEVIARGFEVGALGATDLAIPFYRSLGWQVWEGPLSALTPDGIVPTPDEAGGIMVLPGSAPLDVRGELTCDWRDGAVW